MSRESRRFRAPLRRIRDAVDAGFDAIGATGVRWDRDEMSARASKGFSFLSYGEDLFVELFEDGEVMIESKSSFPLQWDIWGVNSGNCRKFLRAVEDELDEDGA